MASTLKVDTIVHPTGTPNNLTLDNAGNVTIGNNLTVTGTTTQTGASSFTGQILTSAGTAGAPAVARSGDADNGIFFPATNTMAISTAGTEDMRFTPEGNVTMNSATFSPTTPGTAGNMAMTGTLAMGSSFLRNRIINGAMVINQRNTAVTANGYTVDRWQFAKSNDATESVAQNTDAPAGFSYSIRDTVSVADTSIGAAQYAAILQYIEGYNIADFSFGTANAKTITISFWVKATQTGTYSCVLQGGTPGRQVWKAYTVSSSNTWEYKTLTFSGDTNTGSTWDATNGAGLAFQFYYALGSNFQNGTDGTWASTSTNNFGPSGMSNALATNGNIYAVTGVQLEVGSVATPFERRQYGQELALCQRYYCTVIGGGHFITSGANYVGNYIGFPVTMRATPTVTRVSDVVISSMYTPYSQYASTSGFEAIAQATGAANCAFITNYTAAIEL